MRKVLAIALVGTLMLAAIPGAALAGDHRSANKVLTGVAIGATAAVVGGILLNALTPPPPVVYAPAPPVVYAPPPPVVYAPAPPVIYSAPRVIYRPAPVVVHRHWTPRGHWEQWRHDYRGHRH